MEHIGRRHRGQSANLLDADLGPTALVGEHVDDGLRPVRTVTHQAEIAERLLRAAQPAFPFAELVAESHEQHAVPPTLELRERQNARQVVALGRFFFFAEIGDQVTAVLVARGHAVEQKGVHVVVERLVVEEQLAEKAEIPAPPPLPPPVDFEK